MEDTIQNLCKNPYEVAREDKLMLYTQFLKSSQPTSIKMLKEREKFLSVSQSLLYWSPSVLKYGIVFLGYSYFMSYVVKNKPLQYLAPGVIVGTIFYHDYQIRRLKLYSAAEKNEHELISHYCTKPRQNRN